MSLSGNKPKTMVKRIRYNNPTFTSYDVTNMFNPQIFGQKDYYQRRFKVKQKNNNGKDSLSKAQSQYEEKRSKSVIHQPITKNQVKQKITKSDFQQVYKTQRKLNFFNDQSIRNKQLHGFNILSNI